MVEVVVKCFNENIPLPLSRKVLQEGFWNDELHSEIIDQRIDYKFYKPEDREVCMIKIEEMRTESLYTHECSEGCKNRGVSYYFNRSKILYKTIVKFPKIYK